MNAKIVVITDRKVFPKEERTILSQTDKRIIWVDLFKAHKPTGNISIKKTDDYLNKQLYERIDEGATYFAQHWTQIGSQNVSRYNSICLSELVEFDALLFYIKVLKNLELFQQIILKESPDEIILISEDELLRNILLLVTGKQGIKVRIISRFVFRIKNKANNYFKYLIEKYKIDIKKVLFFLVKLKNLKIRNMFLHRYDSRRPAFFVNNNWVVQPVVEKLLKEEKANIIFFNTHVKIFEQYIKKDYPIAMFFEFKVKREVKRNIKRTQRHFRRVWERLLHNEDFKNRFVYQDVLFWKIIKKKLEYFWTKRFLWGIRNLERIKQTIQENNVEITVFWNDVLEPGKTLISISREVNIPSLLIPDGTYADGFRMGEKIYADKVAVWGEYTKHKLLQWGNPESKIFITGNPAYDRLINMASKSKENKEKVIVFATQMVDYYSSTITDTNEEIINVLYAAIKKIPNTRFIIKVHPGEIIKKYQKLVKSKGYGNIEVVKKIDLFALLKDCSILVTHSSTAALDALILDRPVIIINLTGKPDQVSYVQSEAAFGIYNEKDVYPAIVNILNNFNVQNRLAKKREKFVLENAYKLDGKTTLRIISLIEEILNKKIVKTKIKYNAEKALKKPFTVQSQVVNLTGHNKHVLEIGCNMGETSFVLRKNGCKVTGIEKNEEAARIAKNICDEVIIGDIEDESTLGKIKGKYDVVTLIDVLEHLRNPENVLKEVKKHLKQNGFSVISLPNIANWRIRVSLLFGKFEYKSTGILDNTHLRSYTLKSAMRLIEKEYKIENYLPAATRVPKILLYIFPALFATQWIFKCK